ncbi:hypothetical protein ACLOJK_034849 [Asimina triloba]
MAHHVLLWSLIVVVCLDSGGDTTGCLFTIVGYEGDVVDRMLPDGFPGVRHGGFRSRVGFRLSMLCTDHVRPFHRRLLLDLGA